MAASSAQTPKNHLATFADLLRIPEAERRHEILDGEIVQRLMPGGEHGDTHSGVLISLGGFRRQTGGPDRPGGWRILITPTVRLSAHQVVEPDLAGWRLARMPERPSGYPLTLRPDWVCEIMCDSDARRRDGLLKRRIYADHGVPHYWLVDTERERLQVLRLGEFGYEEVLDVDRGQRVRAEPVDAMELAVGVLFGDDPE